MRAGSLFLHKFHIEKRLSCQAYNHDRIINVHTTECTPNNDSSSQSRESIIKREITTK